LERDRVRFLRFLKSGEARSQSKAGCFISLGNRQSQRLWSLYKAKGLEGLLENKITKRGRWGNLSSTESAHLLNCLENDDFETQKQVSEFINAQYGKSYSQSGIHRLLKRLGVKLKTARPINYKQDKGALDYFKKKVKKNKRKAPRKNLVSR